MLPDDFLYPIEGRHESWFSDEVIKFLEEKKVYLVWNDVKGRDDPMPITTNYLYIRLIGDRSIPDSEFGKVIKNKDELITDWTKKLRVIQNISQAFLMTNNHYEGFGPDTANSLRIQLGMRDLI